MNDVFGYFIIGFAAGYVWNPICATIKKIFIEARKAQKEWNK